MTEGFTPFAVWFHKEDRGSRDEVVVVVNDDPETLG
jgi:hypothetical protein